jgi:hypothetical protein
MFFWRDRYVLIDWKDGWLLDGCISDGFSMDG